MSKERVEKMKKQSVMYPLFIGGYSVLVLLICQVLGRVFEAGLSQKVGLSTSVYDGLVFAIWFVKILFPILWVWQSYEVAYDSLIVRIESSRQSFGQLLLSTIRKLIVKLGGYFLLGMSCQIMYLMEDVSQLNTQPYDLVGSYIVFMMILALVKALLSAWKIRNKDVTSGHLFGIMSRFVAIAVVLQFSSLVIQANGRLQ